MIVNPLGDPAFEEDPDFKLSTIEEKYYITITPFPYVWNKTYRDDRYCEIISFETYKKCGNNEYAKFWEC